MDGTYTQKKKNRAAIPEFHYFTVINTWLQTLVTQSVSFEEKEKKKNKTLRNKYTPWYMQDKGYFSQHVSNPSVV